MPDQVQATEPPRGYGRLLLLWSWTGRTEVAFERAGTFEGERLIADLLFSLNADGSFQAQRYREPGVSLDDNRSL